MAHNIAWSNLRRTRIKTRGRTIDSGQESKTSHEEFYKRLEAQKKSGLFSKTNIKPQPTKPQPTKPQPTKPQPTKPRKSRHSRW